MKLDFSECSKGRQQTFGFMAGNAIMGSLFLFYSSKKHTKFCTAPQKLDIKNLTFGVFFNEINL